MTSPSAYRLIGASYVILRRGSQVLLTRRHRTGWRDGYWSLPAGHVEWDESCRQTAIREAFEEIGVKIDPADLGGLCTVHRSYGKHNPIDERADFFFVADRWEGEPRIMELDKSDGLAWFELDGLPTPVVDPVDKVLAGLRGGDLPAILSDGFAD